MVSDSPNLRARDAPHRVARVAIAAALLSATSASPPMRFGIASRRCDDCRGGTRCRVAAILTQRGAMGVPAP